MPRSGKAVARLAVLALLRAAMLSDLHFDPLYEADFLRRVDGEVNRLSPDLIFHTGDFFTHSADRAGELWRS
ncbi:MAG: hypothetical protein R3F11_18675 [Verrucomicrobiales bacterium]